MLWSGAVLWLGVAVALRLQRGCEAGMELLRIGITSTLVAAWYAAVLTLVGCTAAAGHGAEAAATDVPELPVFPVGADLAAQRTGGYHSQELDTAYRIWSDDGRLRLRMGRSVPYDLDVVGPDTLAFAGGRLAVLRADGGRVRGLALLAGRMGRLVLDREGVPPEIVIPRGSPRRRGRQGGGPRVVGRPPAPARGRGGLDGGRAGEARR